MIKKKAISIGVSATLVVLTVAIIICIRPPMPDDNSAATEQTENITAISRSDSMQLTFKEIVLTVTHITDPYTWGNIGQNMDGVDIHPPLIRLKVISRII